MKSQADKSRRNVEFKVNDYVWVKLIPYRQLTVMKRSNEKMAPKYFGSFRIEKKIGIVAYKLQLPVGSKIHPVFHVSQLRAVIGEHSNDITLPDKWEESQGAQVYP